MVCGKRSPVQLIAKSANQIVPPAILWMRYKSVVPDPPPPPPPPLPFLGTRLTHNSCSWGGGRQCLENSCNFIFVALPIGMVLGSVREMNSE